MNEQLLTDAMRLVKIRESMIATNSPIAPMPDGGEEYVWTAEDKRLLADAMGKVRILEGMTTLAPKP